MPHPDRVLQAHYRAAAALEQLGRREEALDALDRALALDPGSEEVAAARARVAEHGTNATPAVAASSNRCGYLPACLPH